METTRLIYNQLFSVQFLHNGYGTPRPAVLEQNIEFIPDADSAKLFRDHSMGYRLYNHTLVVFIRCAETAPPVPFVPIQRPVRIRFYVKVSADFLRKTTAMNAGATNVYLFSNRVNAGTGLFLGMHTTGINADDLHPVGSLEANQNSWAILDIYNTGAINNTYELFAGPDGRLNSPAYSVRFISQIP